MDWKGYQEEEDIKEAEKFYGRNKLVYNIAVSLLPVIYVNIRSNMFGCSLSL